ncbi:MAG: hypothetical protein K2M29_08150 [Paramuribaculum sp.]|nr:hypothetical protein [Paramuribaculum sp.]
MTASKIYILPGLVILSALACFVSGCSCSGTVHDDSATAADSIDNITVAPCDSDAYLRGVDDATALLEVVSDSHRLHDGLLEVRARETQIRTTERPEAANAYIKGFRHHIQAHNDTLARILF